MTVPAGPPGDTGYEPNIGITPDGVLYTYTTAGQGIMTILRSTDAGDTWEIADDSRVREPVDVDPWLHVDSTTGRVFSAPLAPPCIFLQWTDDGGSSWQTNPRGGCGDPLFHFQKLTTGPPAAGVATNGYPNVVYVSSLSVRQVDPGRPTYVIVGGTGGYVSRSLDGGRTFSASVEAHPMEDGCYALPGGVVVDAAGIAYTFQGRCNGVRVARSLDSGASWQGVALLDDVGWFAYGSAPGAAVAPDGTLLLAYHGADGSTYARESTDQGVSWTAAMPITDGRMNATMFPMVAIDEHGNAFASFLGTESDPSGWQEPMSTYAPATATWNLYVAARPAGATEWTLERVTDDRDPVQRGCIYMAGDDGAQGTVSPCRNLGDFTGMVAKDGRAWLAYVDGCDACPDSGTSQDGRLHVARWGLPSRETNNGD